MSDIYKAVKWVETIWGFSNNKPFITLENQLIKTNLFVSMALITKTKVQQMVKIKDTRRLTLDMTSTTEDKRDE